VYSFIYVYIYKAIGIKDLKLRSQLPFAIFCSVRHYIGLLPLVTITNGFIKRVEKKRAAQEVNHLIKLLREIDGTDICQEYFDGLN